MQINKLTALLMSGLFAAILPLQAMAQDLLLTEGTPIRLKLVDSLSSGKNRTGDSINFTVSDDVMADDGTTVLIKAGAPAWGTVSDCQKRAMMGQKGELSISIDGTKSVDGKKVPLRANVSRDGNSKLGATVALSLIVTPLFLLMKGKDAKIPAGTQISGYIDRDTTIAVAAPSVEAGIKPASLSTSAQVVTPAQKEGEVPGYLQKYTETDKNAEALKALDQLKSQGLLTQKEYDAKKEALSKQ